MADRLFQEIVVGTDGSKTAEEAVRQATELAQAAGARVHVVTAYHPGQHGERLSTTARRAPVDLPDVAAALLARARERIEGQGVAVETHAREGDPAEALIDVAAETGADLIVVGNKGMAGAARFLLGSVPNKVSHHAPSSVLIVRTT